MAHPCNAGDIYAIDAVEYMLVAPAGALRSDGERVRAPAGRFHPIADGDRLLPNDRVIEYTTTTSVACASKAAGHERSKHLWAQYEELDEDATSEARHTRESAELDELDEPESHGTRRG